VLFGGKSASGPTQNTWIWNGTTWIDRTPQPLTSDPLARYGHMMVFDVVNQTVLLVYGRTDTTFTRDYWKWDGTAWTPLASMGLLPYNLVGMLAYDAARRQLVYLYNTIVRIRSAATFTGPPLLVAPPARTHAAAAFDARRGKVVLYGGGLADGASGDPALIVPNDTWEWNGSQWAIAGAAANPNPGPRRGAGMTYSLRDGIVLEGGNTNELWKWSGSAWTQLAPAPVGMTDRWAGGMTYDRERDRVIVSGGSGTARRGHRRRPRSSAAIGGTSRSATTRFASAR